MKRVAVVVVAFAVVLPLFALDVSSSITNRSSTARLGELVTGGVPFAQGALSDVSRVRLLRGASELPGQFLPTAHWPDGSIRWLLADTIVDLPSSSTVPLTVQTGHAPQPVAGITVAEDATSYTIDTRRRQIRVPKTELPEEWSFAVVSGGTRYIALPLTSTIEERGPVKVVVRLDGELRPASGPFAAATTRFRQRLTFALGDERIRVAATFRNNGGFNWEGSMERGPDIVVSEVWIGSARLEAVPLTFGPGVERTWRVITAPSAVPVRNETRYTAAGSIAPGYREPDALLVADPSYYAATKAWGVVTFPVSNGGALQPELDRFEKIQRAKVIAADVEDPPNVEGITLWEHLAQDLASSNDYGDLRWDGNGCGTLSGNHYDWSYGMYLQFMRTGQLAFADAARVFAIHEIDLDVYHTAADGTAYNFQKNWEDRPSHDSPDNCFGGGRPTHTWTQGYALHWLLTGDRRALDAFQELQEGIRQFLYESFVDDGKVNTNEIRTQGWIVDNLVARWRIEPHARIQTPAGEKTIPQVIRDVLTNVFEREAAAGGRGYVYASPSGGDEHQWDENLRSPLMNAYFLEPAIKAYDEVLRTADPPYAASLLALIRRMTDFLISVTYGGDTNGEGGYRPLQIPYFVDVRQPLSEGQIPYLLMAANAAGFVFREAGAASYRDYARSAFRDYVRYVGAIGGDTYGDPSLRTPASYNSVIFTGTESKIHGWSSRYGQYYLLSEQTSAPSGGRRRAVRK